MSRFRRADFCELCWPPKLGADAIVGDGRAPARVVVEAAAHAVGDLLLAARRVHAPVREIVIAVEDAEAALPLARGLRDDVDDAVEGVCAVQRGARASDDLD